MAPPVVQSEFRATLCGERERKDGAKVKSKKRRNAVRCAQDSCQIASQILALLNQTNPSQLLRQTPLQRSRCWRTLHSSTAPGRQKKSRKFSSWQSTYCIITIQRALCQCCHYYYMPYTGSNAEWSVPSIFPPNAHAPWSCGCTSAKVAAACEATLGRLLRPVQCRVARDCPATRVVCRRATRCVWSAPFCSNICQCHRALSEKYDAAFPGIKIGFLPRNNKK